MVKLSDFKGKVSRLLLALILGLTLLLAGGKTKPAVAAASAKAIAAGELHTCALTEAGGVQCWGNNENGQLGNGTTTNSNIPVDVSGFSSGVKAIAAGTYHTCAVTSAGGVQCWGHQYSNTPVNVSGLSSGVVAVAAGDFHTCALTEAGGAQCWGNNGSGQLGNGTYTSSNTPVNVSGLSSGVKAVAAGGDHTCAVTNTGGVQCWGDNNHGQLGNGNGPPSNTPVNVSRLGSEVVTITAGSYHTCALTSAGGVQCWGLNGNGQLGNGRNTDSNTPVNVSGLGSGVVAIAASVLHTCAVTSAGGVQCWGYNHWGQLGNGTYTPSNTPVNVSGLSSGVVAVAAGDFHTCAVTNAGGVRCWGRNDYGQLGNETYESSRTPVDVVDFNDLTLLEHDAHLTERANAIDAALASIMSRLDALDLDLLDVAVSSRASQASVDTLSSTVGEIQNQIDALSIDNLDATISSRASQTSVDALSSTVSNVESSVNDLQGQVDSVEGKIDLIQASLNTCEVSIAMVEQGEGHNNLEFYLHTTLAGERVEPDSLTVWVGREQVTPTNLDFESILTGVTWLWVDGYKWSEMKNQPLTVEAVVSKSTCSDMLVINKN